MGDGSEPLAESGEKQERESEKPDSENDEGSDDQKVTSTDNDDDPFGASGFSRSGASTLTSTLRALTGMISGQSSRLRAILANLKQKDDSTLHLVALQELSEILLVSTEDNLAGHFSPDQYVKELIALMQPNEFGEENPEIMLLACRCIANMMEALPASTSNVVYGGAVPILCQKLLEINFIDLAEQSLSVRLLLDLFTFEGSTNTLQTLEKISVEFPSSIVREGGLTACLTYLDFFPTSTQRVAVTTAANCCRNIPEDSFTVVRDVMPILLNVLNSSDQRVVEQGCLCVSRIVESFKYNESKLEQLISPEFLRIILRLLLPGSTSLIKPKIQTQFLRVLAITSRASPRLSKELFKLNVVDTLFQILTGVSSPSDDLDGNHVKVDSVIVMQALIHRPADQIFETLNVISEVLPSIPKEDLSYLGGFRVGTYSKSDLGPVADTSTKSSHERMEFLRDCEQELRRFAVILFPTLTDAYSSTVNLNVRQKVLSAQLKMLSNLDVNILTDALRPIAYASFLATILWQQDHPSLVIFALQAAELLQKRLTSIYQDQFHREGVISEIARIAAWPSKILKEKSSEDKSDNQEKPSKMPENDGAKLATSSENTSADVPSVAESEPDRSISVGENEEHNDDEEDDDDDDDDDDGEDADDNTDMDSSSSSGDNHQLQRTTSDLEDMITQRAKHFMELHGTGGAENGKENASRILADLTSLSQEIKQCNEQKERSGDEVGLLERLASYFSDDAINGITSYELLSSGVVDALLQILSHKRVNYTGSVENAFVKAFMRSGASKKTSDVGTSQSTPFEVLIAKAQDLLSRAEHFEVITVHQSPFDSYKGNAASNLAKQLRLRLVADEGADVPRPYRNVMVSIHAIATFKALDDYLRPRMSLAERPRNSRGRDGISSTIAAYAAALASRADPDSDILPSKISCKTLLDNNGHTGSKKQPSQKSSKVPSPVQASSSGGVEKEDEKGKHKRRLKNRGSLIPEIPPPPPPPPPPHSDDAPHVTLECADETQLADEEDTGDDSTLNAIVDDLEDGMDGSLPDPSAVNVEVASSGKVTAREEDGTRIATPSHTSNLPASAPSAKPLATSQGQPTPTSSKPMTYATAVQSIPQDWHIEFSVNDQPISSNTTIYQAVHFNQSPGSDVSSRSLWSAVHTIKFKRVSGPPPSVSKTKPAVDDAVSKSTELPQSLAKNKTAASILRLLSILYDVNANVNEILPENTDITHAKPEPLSHFVNTKLTAKLNRQLEEPLIVASNCLPSWSEDLARLYPFVFPFESRHLFLQCTSFGYSRSMARWQNAQPPSDSRSARNRDDRPFLGRLQRQKVRISRTRILESAIKVMELYGSSPSVLEVEYFEEVGTGLGPTLEFYSTVSKEFCKKRLKLWRENDSTTADDYVSGKGGLFPAPMTAAQADTESGKRILHLFRILGKFVARSMLDSRMVDVPLNAQFFRSQDTVAAEKQPIAAIDLIDEGLAKALRMLNDCAMEKKRIDGDETMDPKLKSEAVKGILYQGSQVEDLGLDFTLPGYPTIELVPEGSKMSVDISNVGLYVEKVIDFTLFGGVQRQMDAFRSGFSQVFPYNALRAFTSDELVMLFGRVDEDWSLESKLCCVFGL